MDKIDQINKILHIGKNFHMCDVSDVSEKGVFLKSWNTLVPITDFEAIKKLIFDDTFDITGFELYEIPHPQCFCFYNATRKQSFDVAKFWDDKWQFSYTACSNKGFMSMKAESISEAVNKYEDSLN